MKTVAMLTLFTCLLFSIASQAGQTSAYIKNYAAYRDSPLIDAVREFIYEHSDHGEGLWSEKHGNDTAFVLDHLYRTAIGDTTAARPELLCGHRSAAMQALLGKFGIRSRTIYLYSQYAGPFMGHVFLEVMNPITGRWEIQDPDYNAAYEYEDGKRLGIADLIALPDFSKVYPVNAVARGWMAAKVVPLMNGEFFNVAFSPTEGMLYYNQQALDAGLVSSAESYIRENHGGLIYTPAQIGRTSVRPLLDFKENVYEYEALPDV